MAASRRPPSTKKKGRASRTSSNVRAGDREVSRATRREATGRDLEAVLAYADEVAKTQIQKTEKTRDLKTWVTVGIANEVFALPIEPVREILRVSRITRVPHAPPPICGVTNLRGQVLPVADLRLRLGLPPADSTRRARIVVVSAHQRLFGLVVDEAMHVMRIDMNEVKPPPEDVVTVQSDYLTGVYSDENRLILLADVDRMLVFKEAAAS